MGHDISRAEQATETRGWNLLARNTRKPTRTSLFGTREIVAIGVAQSYCWESPKPAEFGNTGQYWED